MAGLPSVFESLVQACSPTQDDHLKRVQLIQQIEKTLSRSWSVENLRVIPYGSFVSQFYNSSSDLDLAICGSFPTSRLKPSAVAEIFRGSPEESHVPLHKLDKRTKTQLLRDAGSRLSSAGLASRGTLEFILHARVPIIKFVDRGSGIEVDICLGSEATPFKAWSVAQVASVHPAFGKLFRVVKVWAKAHAINDGASHMFNSWCLTLVVMFFLQTQPQPPLLPPLYALLYENPPEASRPRLLQGGAELPAQAYEVMERRAARAKEVYGSRSCKPLDELFRDFVADGARKLRSLLASQDSFLRDTRMSAFYGQLQTSRPFPSSYVMCVEDPYDDTDNTARTLGTWDGHPGTIHYVTSVFERTLRHLNRHIETATASAAAGAESAAAESAAAAVAAAMAALDPSGRAAAPTPAPGPAPDIPSGKAEIQDKKEEEGEENGHDDDDGARSSSAASATSSSPSFDFSAEGEGEGEGKARRRLSSEGAAPSTAPPSAAASASAPVPVLASPACPPSLASTLVFLFGTELLTRLPDLSDQLLGRQLCDWARGALAAGRPEWEVHEGMLNRMGAAGEFVSFDSFKRRHKIRVHNEAKYATPEEKAAAAAREAERKAAKKAKDRERREARKAREVAAAVAASGQRAQPQPNAAKRESADTAKAAAAVAVATATATTTAAGGGTEVRQAHVAVATAMSGGGKLRRQIQDKTHAPDPAHHPQARPPAYTPEHPPPTQPAANQQHPQQQHPPSQPRRRASSAAGDSIGAGAGTAAAAPAVADGAAATAPQRPAPRVAITEDAKAALKHALRPVTATATPSSAGSARGRHQAAPAQVGVQGLGLGQEVDGGLGRKSSDGAAAAGATAAAAAAAAAALRGASDGPPAAIATSGTSDAAASAPSARTSTSGLHPPTAAAAPPPPPAAPRQGAGRAGADATGATIQRGAGAERRSSSDGRQLRGSSSRGEQRGTGAAAGSASNDGGEGGLGSGGARIRARGGGGGGHSGGGSRAASPDASIQAALQGLSLSMQQPTAAAAAGPGLGAGRAPQGRHGSRSGGVRSGGGSRRGSSGGGTAGAPGGGGGGVQQPGSGSGGEGMDGGEGGNTGEERRRNVHGRNRGGRRVHRQQQR